MVRNNAAGGVSRSREANHSRPVRRAHCRALVRAIKRRSARPRAISSTAEISSVTGSTSQTAGPAGPATPGAGWVPLPGLWPGLRPRLLSGLLPRLLSCLLRVAGRGGFKSGKDRKIYRFPIEPSARATGDRSKNHSSRDFSIFRGGPGMTAKSRRKYTGSHGGTGSKTEHVMVFTYTRHPPVAASLARRP